MGAPIVMQGEAPASPLPRGERGGEFVKGLSAAPLDERRGQRPPLPLVQNGGEAADLINTAQVTPRHRERLREAQRVRRKVGRRNRLYPVREVYRTAALGMGRGFRQTGLTKGEWDLAPGCAAPVPVQMDGAPARMVGGRHVRADGKPFGLTLFTKCRRCADCLRKRRNLWAYRAQEEVKNAVRTWFATFTLNPHEHALVRFRASARLRARGSNLEVLPESDQSEEIAAEYRRQVTLYFKRLRKQTGANLRYILVQEQHKSGLPHFHALIHETEEDRPLKHAVLSAQWKLGYTKFKLVKELKTAWYVAKYLAKEVNNRVRASLHYGHSKHALTHRTVNTGRDEHPPLNNAKRCQGHPCSEAPLWGAAARPLPSSPLAERIYSDAIRRIFLRQDKAGDADGPGRSQAPEPLPAERSEESPETEALRTAKADSEAIGAALSLANTLAYGPGTRWIRDRHSGVFRPAAPHSFGAVHAVGAGEASSSD